MALPPLYSALNSLQTEIRLLTIEPSRSHEAPITCRLSHARLSDNPIYDALSYTWGAPGEADYMTVIALAPAVPVTNSSPNQYEQLAQPQGLWQQKNREFKLHENASAAIRRLRHRSNPATVWIDAVCINQQDDREKESQIPLMRRIYEQANQVCIWLGEMTELSILGVEDMQSRVGREYKPWTGFSTTFQKASVNLLLPSGMLKNGANSVAFMHSTNLTNELVLGEVREILARPWWTRVWIMQEAIVARRLILMCGDQTFDWDGVGRAVDRMRGTMGIRGAIEVFGTVMNPEVLVEDQTYRLISRFRDIWSKKRWNVSIFELMYEFRRLDCTDPRDRIFGFLGLAAAAFDFEIKADYQTSTVDVFIHSSRTIIEKSESLDLLNCRREWNGVERATRLPDSLAYSIQDQAKYHDVQATVSDGPDSSLRKGWARLPPGWERMQRENPKIWSRVKNALAGKGCFYRHHNTGASYEESPLLPLPPPLAQHPVKQRVLPPGWIKKWDNLGRAQVMYVIPGQQQPQPPSNSSKGNSTNLNNLPSWVPNWAAMTSRDPEPLLDWSETPRYWAAGNTVPVIDTSQSSPRTLGLEGILFDEVECIAPPWHPTSQVPPITRTGIPELQNWEDLALSEVSSCPYANPPSNLSRPPPDGTNNPRKTALWRTLITDYAGHLASPASNWSMVELWHDDHGDPCNPTWATRLPDLDTMASKGFIGHAMASRKIYYSDVDMHSALLQLDSSKGRIFSYEKQYGEIMRRIHSVCKHRALFVTKRGYIGLAPWNAAPGDSVVILKGGKTPFLLRLAPVIGRYTLVGEAFVYGIMAGEVMGMVGEQGVEEGMFYLV